MTKPWMLLFKTGLDIKACHVANDYQYFKSLTFKQHWPKKGPVNVQIFKLYLVNNRNFVWASCLLHPLAQKAEQKYLMSRPVQWPEISCSIPFLQIMTGIIINCTLYCHLSTKYLKQ